MRLLGADFFSARKLELPKLSPEAEVVNDEHMAFRELRLRQGHYFSLNKYRRGIIDSTEGQVRTQQKREKSGPNFLGSSVLAGRGACLGFWSDAKEKCRVGEARAQ